MSELPVLHLSTQKSRNPDFRTHNSARRETFRHWKAGKYSPWMTSPADAAASEANKQLLYGFST